MSSLALLRLATVVALTTLHPTQPGQQTLSCIPDIALACLPSICKCYSISPPLSSLCTVLLVQLRDDEH